MKISGFLSELLIADLAKLSGIAFKYPDRITRAEAEKAIDWAKAQPEVAAAYGDKGNAGHKAVMLYKQMIIHFQSAHGQDAAGEPVAWPERVGKPLSETSLDGLTPDEAAALHAWAQTSQDYRDAYHDASHPQHAGIVARTKSVMEIAARAEGAEAPTAEAAAPVAAPPGGKMDGAMQKRLDELRADSAFLDKSHANHKAILEAITRLYESLPGGSATSAPAKGTAAAPTPAATRTPQERIAALKDNPAYWDKSLPGHAEAAQEAASAFAAAYPEPAAGST